MRSEERVVKLSYGHGYSEKEIEQAKSIIGEAIITTRHYEQVDRA